MQVMLNGEPYLTGYLAHVEDDLRAAGFAKVDVRQPIPGRAEAWFCHEALRLPKNSYTSRRRSLDRYPNTAKSARAQVQGAT